MRGGPAGDLYIFLAIKPHALFQRDGTTIFCPVPIPMTTAALGGSIEVPTIEGKLAKLSIPSGTQSGRQFRLRGKGMTPVRGGIRGDMLIETVVETPVHLTSKQKGTAEAVRRSRDRQAEAPSGVGRVLHQGEGALAGPDGIDRLLV